MHRLDRLSADLGVDLWIKRDDLTGFAAGGNKGRKIEFLIAEALASGAETLVCQGATQSNFVRQLGAACAMFGLECHAVVMDLPYYATAGKPAGAKAAHGGNLILDEIFGVQMHKVPDGDWDELEEATMSHARTLENEGRRVYVVAIGGSSPQGAFSFALAAQEVLDSGQEFDFLVTPSSSGSTHAGLAYGFSGARTQVIGVNADPDPDDVLANDIVDLMAGIDEITGLHKQLKRSDVRMKFDFCGEAYGIPSREGQFALELFARREGIVLDPVYSAKAAAGLLDMISSGQIGGRILFWHTGGLPVVFAY